MDSLAGLDKRILVVIPHFFNSGKHELLQFGSHETKNASSRKKVVDKSYESLVREIRSCGLNEEIIFLGIGGSTLMELQVEVSPNDPRHLPWLAFEYAYKQAHLFDFILVLEDDLELDRGTLEPLLRINSKVGSKKTLIPNRIETFRGISYCTDLIAMPGWKSPIFNYEGIDCREPINIHSGFLLLDANRFVAAYEERPFEFPTQIIGDFMASAFANMHAYQEIIRAIPTTNCVTIKHNDNWAMRMIEFGILDEKEVLKRIEFSATE